MQTKELVVLTENRRAVFELLIVRLCLGFEVGGEVRNDVRDKMGNVIGKVDEPDSEQYTISSNARIKNL